ncbi:hypothetical protein AX14_011412 [Amanita brunnescens Koide BX004]|nr:hypothetical protein AX14_011412 [Amanita brunnescens Koide BX004]
MPTQLRQLLDLITNSIETLEKTCAANGTEVPDLQGIFSPASEAFRADPVAGEAADIISAAALQLSAIVAPPHITLFNAVGGHYRSAAARMCLESQVTEILREAGPEGLHVNEIAAKNGMNSQQLARCLRLLATEHIYRENKPDVFANNRISSVLDTLKPSAEIIADPDGKYDNTNGFAAFAAFASHQLDECFKGSSLLLEHERDPKTKSEEPSDVAVGRAYSKRMSYFNLLSEPDNSFMLRRLNTAMLGFKTMVSDDVSFFDWKSLPNNAVVVDVGGGVGAMSMVLARNYSHFQIVIQDRPQVRDDAIKIWNSELPDALSSGRVKIEAHDFFEPQPHHNASVFFLKNVLHDWSDEYCVKILKPLREAATPNTILILMESISPYACHVVTTDNGIKGAVAQEAPPPLLANWGASKEMVYIVDMTMMVLCNSLERTVIQFDQLLRRAGWRIRTVHRRTGPNILLMSSIEAVPVL